MSEYVDSDYKLNNYKSTTYIIIQQFEDMVILQSNSSISRSVLQACKKGNTLFLEM